MSPRPDAFNTPYEVVRPTPYQCLSALGPDGAPNDDGVLQSGQVVWTHRMLPKVKGHRTALGFIDSAGEVLVDVTALRPKGHLEATQPSSAPTRA